jgi:putative phosphoribosyl transferase
MPDVTLLVDIGRIVGTLEVPAAAHGVVIFAHGSGSSRHSPRNRHVAALLNDRGFATLLMDLLTAEEEEVDNRTAALRFDIALLARRIEMATRWCSAQRGLAALPIGYFGASTGAGAALLAAADRQEVRAVVSRGGRPDLANDALRSVRAATLLIVGEQDPVVIDLNRKAASQIKAPCEIAVIPRAGHLFEEPGALDEVARLAQNWLLRYMKGMEERG